ncbi:hypothetical protein ACHAPJ_012203 [Fusarium lateritium]
MDSFKVIVVGAGPTGLVLAHALQASGIDYVLVEQRSQVPPDPAYGLFIWPHIVRIFHQLGLLDAVTAVALPMVGTIHMSDQGDVLHRDSGFEQLRALHGYPMQIFNRANFATTLLESLDNWQQRVKTNKRLINIVSDKTGVKCEFADGTEENGSIVIGADGIWSSVRDQMKAKAPEGLFDQTPNPFEASYAGVFGKTNTIMGLDPGRIINVYQKGTLVQVFTAGSEAQLVIYYPIAPSKERTRFGQNDAEEVCQPWLDVPVGKGVKFGDLWKEKVAGGSANYDEGVLPWWHWGRMVLVGDAAHKMNPIRGAGACCGIEDAIALVNNLKRLLRFEPNPSDRDLRMSFVAFQYEREAAAKLWMDVSRLNLDLSTKPQPALKAASIADYRCLPLVADGPILDHVPFPDEKKGFVPWRRKPRALAAIEQAKARL